MDSALPVDLTLDEELAVAREPAHAKSVVLLSAGSGSVHASRTSRRKSNQTKSTPREDLTIEVSGCSDYLFAVRLQQELNEKASVATRVAEDADLAFALSLSEPAPKRSRGMNLEANCVANLDYSLALQLSEQGEAKKDGIQSLGGKINLLTHDCYHLPGFLPLHLQQELYLGFERDALLTDPNNPYSLVWDHKKCAGENVKPSQLFAFDIGQRAMAYVSHCTAERLWGEDVHLDCCSTTGYNSKGCLHMHVDWGGVGGWVVLLSLGAKAEFCFGDACMDKSQKCTLSSGDVLILQGSKVYHGIERVWGDAPCFWKLRHTRRLAVQMRDHRQNVPGWNEIQGQL